MKPDGTEVQCLTANAPPILQRVHKGQPFWHPSGKYIVFTAQNEKTKPTEYNLDSFPGIGHNHDIWIMTSDGQTYWRMTTYADNWGCIRPSFSHDGKQIYWNEEYSMEVYPGVGSFWKKDKNRKGEGWGLWRIVLADISFTRAGPKMSNVRGVNINEIHPGFRLIEGSGFTPDDKHLIWEAANLNETDGMMWWGDVYVSDLKGGSLERITWSARRYQGNENMEYSPDGTKIAWSHHDDREPGKKVEIYLMDADGTHPARLTYFNKWGHPHRRQFQRFGYTNACGELDWGPDGKQICFSMSNGATLTWPYATPNIYILTLADQK
jgi:Tol biopolymer transport system component